VQQSRAIARDSITAEFLGITKPSHSRYHSENSCGNPRADAQFCVEHGATCDMTFRLMTVKILNEILRYIDAILFTVFIAAVIARHDYSLRFFIGMAVATFGIALWGVARVQLGSSFAVTAQAKKLVTTGLYSRIRNPVYFFGGIGYLGLFIAWGNWLALVIFVLVFVSYQIPRAKKEQRVLEQAFGDEYRRYRAGTWF